MDLTQYEGILHKSEEERVRIVRETGMFTVALFAVRDTRDGESLELAGTGTLVVAEQSHYILTAAHVWEEMLKTAAKVGITLRENVDHYFPIDVRTIVPFGPPKPDRWSEWGPDITFLRLPPEHVGDINAFRVFYDLAENEINEDYIEAWLLMGAPHALGQFTDRHADISINGFFVQLDPPLHDRGEWDYFDLEMDAGAPGVPEQFGGVSGGGLWKVRIHVSPSTGKIDSVATLEGVAFHQSDLVIDRRIIRCHGKKSIRAALSSALQARRP